MLGPILFLIYVNDVSHYIRDCLILQYADGTQFAHTGTVNNIEGLLKRSEATLSKVKEYFQLNGLMLNRNKTQSIFIGTRGHITQIPSDTSVKVDGTNIVPSTSLKNLGIYFDNYKQIDTHITHICKTKTCSHHHVHKLHKR